MTAIGAGEGRVGRGGAVAGGVEDGEPDLSLVTCGERPVQVYLEERSKFLLLVLNLNMTKGSFPIFSLHSDLVG